MKYDNLSKEELLLKIEKPEEDLIKSKSISKSLKKVEEQNRFHSSFINTGKQALL